MSPEDTLSSMMTLEEFLNAHPYFYKWETRCIHTGDLYKDLGLPGFEGVKNGKEYLQYMEHATEKFSDEELIARLVIAGTLVKSRQCWLFLALKWAAYNRGIPLQSVDELIQDPPTVQTPDPVGPDLP